MTPEQKDVLAAVERMTGAFHNKDLDGIMASYEPGASIIFEPGTASTDEAAIREAFGEFFHINPEFTYGGHEVFVMDNIAVHFAPWTMTGEAPDGTQVKQSGLSVAILRKQADGTWLMIFDNPNGEHLMGL